MSNAVSPIERLVAIEEIRDLKARYFRHTDEKNWVELGKLFTADAVITFPDDLAQPICGRDMPEFAKMALGTSVSAHHGHTSTIEILGPTSAKGMWHLEDLVEWADGLGTGRPQRLHACGYYHETYIKADGRWFITSMRMQRTKFIERPSAPGGEPLLHKKA